MAKNCRLATCEAKQKVQVKRGLEMTQLTGRQLLADDQDGSSARKVIGNPSWAVELSSRNLERTAVFDICRQTHLNSAFINLTFFQRCILIPSDGSSAGKVNFFKVWGHTSFRGMSPISELSRRTFFAELGANCSLWHLPANPYSTQHSSTLRLPGFRVLGLRILHRLWNYLWIYDMYHYNSIFSDIFRHNKNGENWSTERFPFRIILGSFSNAKIDILDTHKHSCYDIIKS